MSTSYQNDTVIIDDEIDDPKKINKLLKQISDLGFIKKVVIKIKKTSTQDIITTTHRNDLEITVTNN